MNKATKNTLIFTGAAAALGAAAAAVSYAAMKSLVKIALDREQPKIYEKQKARLSGDGGQSFLKGSPKRESGLKTAAVKRWKSPRRTAKGL